MIPTASRCSKEIIWPLLDLTSLVLKPKWTDKDSFQRAIDRVKFSLFDRQRRKELQERLQRHNDIIENLASSSIELAPNRRHRAGDELDDFVQIRKDACSLHDALGSTQGPWTCQCPLPHNASLRLEARGCGMPQDITPTNRLTIPLRFRVLFSFAQESAPNPSATLPWNWHETEMQPVGGLLPNIPAISAGSNGLNSTPTSARSVPNSSTASGRESLRKKLQKRVHFSAASRSLGVSRGLAPSSNTAVPQRITNLCLTLKDVREGAPCLGFLLDEHRERRFEIHCVRKHLRLPTAQDFVCLGSFLAASSPDTRETCSIVTFHRKYLALVLASTVLQLHETPWLEERWNKYDICFLRRTDQSREPIFNEPYISKPFASTAASITPIQSVSRSSGGPMVRNKSLFALGVLLIELSYGKPLESLREPCDMGPNGLQNQYTAWLTASRLIKSREISHREGSSYADAVRRCIKCDFDQIDDTLDDRDFRKAYVEGVVLPLQADLKTFNGGKLPRLTSAVLN